MIYQLASGISTPSWDKDDEGSENPGQLNQTEESALKIFLGKSVTAGTFQGYQGRWVKWVAYAVHRGIIDPYLRGRTETEKCSLLCNFFLMRYNEVRRGKGAYEIGASVRKMFQISFQSVSFCDHPMVTAARTACRRSTDELRVMQRAGEGGDKLPISWDMLAWIRDNHWVNKTW